MAELYQSREVIFGLPHTELPMLEQLRKKLEPSANLWRMCGEFVQAVPEWRDGPFTSINAEQMAAECDRCEL